MFPAGKYFVGDLCYVMTNKQWDIICIHDLTEGITDNGLKFAIEQTLCGDGSYSDQFGNSYSVDSGTIGCVQWDESLTHKYGARLQELGAIIDFNKDFEVYESSGMIHIGHISIDTGYTHYENEEYYYDEGYYDNDDDERDE